MFKGTRQCFVAIGPALSLLVLPILSTAASNYPDRPIRFIMAFAPGGGGDIQARIVAKHMSESLGQPVIVDNRPGASGVIGWNLLAKAAPDGYTIGQGSSGLTSVGNFSKLPFDPVTDFAGISLVSLGTNILLVHPLVTVVSVKELVELAKATPGKLNCATAGAGSPMHLASILFNRMAKTHIVDVQYKGGGPALTALLGHEVDFMFGALVQTMPAVASGKLRGIAVTTAKRSPVLPNIPTIAEAGIPGYEFNAWSGVVAPRGTSAEIINRLNLEIVKMLEKPEVRKQLAEAGPASSTPAELQAILTKEVARWRAVLAK